MRSRTSWPTRRAWWGSTRSRGSWTTSSARRSETMRFGYWLPVFGGWLRNVPDEGMEASWEYVSRLARRSEALGFAVRPTFHPPALAAKQAANIDRISRGRLTLNVVSSWWAEEARQYGVEFDRHDARYARTAEWLAVVSGMWAEPRFSFAGPYSRVQDAILEPKPVSQQIG